MSDVSVRFIFCCAVINSKKRNPLGNNSNNTFDGRSNQLDNTFDTIKLNTDLCLCRHEVATWTGGTAIEEKSV